MDFNPFNLLTGKSGFGNFVLSLLSPRSANAMYAGPSATGFQQAQEQNQTWPSPYDQKQRFEISDQESTFRFPDQQKQKEWTEGGQTKFSSKLGQVFGHDKLYKNYPELAEVPVDFDMGKKKGTGGAFNPNENKITIQAESPSDARKTLLHELQHWTQHKEDFATGGDEGTGLFLRALSKGNKDRLNNDVLQLEQIEQQQRTGKPLTQRTVSKFLGEESSGPLTQVPISANPPERPTLMISAKKSGQQMFPVDDPSAIRETLQQRKNLLKKWDKFSQKFDKTEATPRNLYDEYKRLAGEIEARDVESRANLTDEMRRKLKPYSSQNINPFNAITVFGR